MFYPTYSKSPGLCSLNIIKSPIQFVYAGVLFMPVFCLCRCFVYAGVSRLLKVTLSAIVLSSDINQCIYNNDFFCKIGVFAPPKGDHLLKNNYRAITILPKLFKIYERVLRIISSNTMTIRHRLETWNS